MAIIDRSSPLAAALRRRGYHLPLMSRKKQLGYLLNPFRFTVAGGGGGGGGATTDLYYTNTVLSLHMEGADSATVFTDSSSYARAVTPLAAAVTSSAQAVFGSTSFTPGGAGGGLAVAYAPELNFAGNSFTIDGRAYNNTGSGAGTLVDFRGSGAANSSWYIYIDYVNRAVCVYDGPTATLIASSGTNSIPATGTWFNWRIVRAGTLVKVFVDGVMKVSATYSPPATDATGIRIGTDRAGANTIVGYLDEVNFVNGAIRSVIDYTPEILAFGDSQLVSTTPDPDRFYGNNSLLMHFEGTDGGTSFVDSSSYVHTATRVGTPTTVTAQKVFDQTSGLFNGTTDYLTFPNHIAFQFGAVDFCIQTRVRFAGWPVVNNGAYKFNLVGKDVNAVNGREFQFGVAGTAASLTSVYFQGFSTDAASVTASASFNFQLNTWYAITVVRIGGFLYLLVNGILLNPAGTAIAGALQATTTTLRVGGLAYGGGTDYFLNGHLEELRITKDNGRYAKSYLVPNAPFADSLPTSPTYVYPTWNPADRGSTVTLSNGNLNGTSPEANGTVRATMGVSSGKKYWEIKVPNTVSSYSPSMGVATAAATLAHYLGFDAGGWGWSPFESGGPGKYHSGAKIAYGTGCSSGDVIGHALDMDAGTITLYRNNVSMGVMYSGLAGLTLYPCCGGDASGISTQFNANFGATAFTYAPPAGFTAISEVAPVITKVTDIADCLLWLDANDSAQLTLDSSTPKVVSGWRDKANALTYVQATTAQQPTLNVSVFAGGKGFVDFGISAQKWLTSPVNLNIPQGVTVFMVAYWGTRNAAGSSINLQKGTSSSAQNSAAGAPLFAIITTGNTVGAAQFYMSATGQVFSGATNGIAKGGIGQYAVTVPAANVGQGRARLNGADTIVSNVNGAMPAGLQVNTIGNSDTTYLSNGGFAECLMFSRILTIGEIYAVEQLLKAKWGTP